MNDANTPERPARIEQVHDADDNPAWHACRPPARPDPVMELAGGDDPHLALVAVRALRDVADAYEAHQVRQAGQANMTWAEIGRLLGVSAQAAHKKHAHSRQ